MSEPRPDAEQGNEPASGCPLDAPHAGAHMDFSGTMSYGDYLSLGTLLDSQHPRSTDHNELLFIIQHQATELWLKLVLHELSAAREQIRRDDLQPAFKMLSRVARIFAQLVQSWDVLATLTPSEYSAFRPSLGNSSGFQSHQYRQLEFLLGNRNAALVLPFAHRAEIHAALVAELARPSLYDEALRLLARRGLPVPPARCERDWSVRPVRGFRADAAGNAPDNASGDAAVDTAANAAGESTGVEAAWEVVYADPAAHWDLYELAEKLVDLEDAFRQWRFRHVTTVERIIGNKRGTGGTSGVGYLRQAVGVELFPELWRVRTRL